MSYKRRCSTYLKIDLPASPVTATVLALWTLLLYQLQRRIWYRCAMDLTSGCGKD